MTSKKVEQFLKRGSARRNKPEVIRSSAGRLPGVQRPVAALASGDLAPRCRKSIHLGRPKLLREVGQSADWSAHSKELNEQGGVLIMKCTISPFRSSMVILGVVTLMLVSTGNAADGNPRTK